MDLSVNGCSCHIKIDEIMPDSVSVRYYIDDLHDSRKEGTVKAIVNIPIPVNHIEKIIVLGKEFDCFGILSCVLRWYDK